MREVIILAGGLGTRLREVVNDVPKCLAPINGVPFLAYLIDYLEKQKVSRFIFSIGYKGQLIEDFLSLNYSYLDYSISSEKTPLGTGGAIKKALKYSKCENIFVLNGDTFCNFNLDELSNFYLIKNSNFSIGLYLIQDNVRYGHVLVDESGTILEFKEKKNGTNILVNSGVYLIKKSFIINFFNNYPDCFSLETDFFQLNNRGINIHGIELNGEFIDIGIPEDYKKFQNKILNHD